MRLPYAAETLIQQMQDRNKKSSAEPAADPDGYDVVRTVEFDKTTSKFLARVLPVLDDPRIVGFDEKDGTVSVTFADGINADLRDPFALDDADLVSGD